MFGMVPEQISAVYESENFILTAGPVKMSCILKWSPVLHLLCEEFRKFSPPEITVNLSLRCAVEAHLPSRKLEFFTELKIHLEDILRGVVVNAMKKETNIKSKFCLTCLFKRKTIRWRLQLQILVAWWHGLDCLNLEVLNL